MNIQCIKLLTYIILIIEVVQKIFLRALAIGLHKLAYFLLSHIFASVGRVKCFRIPGLAETS